MMPSLEKVKNNLPLYLIVFCVTLFYFLKTFSGPINGLSLLDVNTIYKFFSLKTLNMPVTFLGDNSIFQQWVLRAFDVSLHPFLQAIDLIAFLVLILVFPFFQEDQEEKKDKKDKKGYFLCLLLTSPLLYKAYHSLNLISPAIFCYFLIFSYFKSQASIPPFQRVALGLFLCLALICIYPPLFFLFFIFQLALIIIFFIKNGPVSFLNYHQIIFLILILFLSLLTFVFFITFSFSKLTILKDLVGDSITHQWAFQFKPRKLHAIDTIYHFIQFSLPAIFLYFISPLRFNLKKGILFFIFFILSFLTGLLFQTPIITNLEISFFLTWSLFYLTYFFVRPDSRPSGIEAFLLTTLILTPLLIYFTPFTSFQNFILIIFPQSIFHLKKLSLSESVSSRKFLSLFLLLLCTPVLFRILSGTDTRVAITLIGALLLLASTLFFNQRYSFIPIPSLQLSHLFIFAFILQFYWLTTNPSIIDHGKYFTNKAKSIFELTLTEEKKNDVVQLLRPQLNNLESVTFCGDQVSFLWFYTHQINCVRKVTTLPGVQTTPRFWIYLSNSEKTFSPFYQKVETELLVEKFFYKKGQIENYSNVLKKLFGIVPLEEQNINFFWGLKKTNS